MQAQSLLGSARALDRRLDDLLSATVLAGDPAAWDDAAVVRTTLTDVAEQLRAGAPFPTGGDPAPRDEAFVGLLAALDERDRPTPERVAAALDGGERALDRLRETGRVEVAGSRVVVPLGRDPAGSNWWALLEYLRDSVADLAGKASRVRGRVVVDGADAALVAAWDSVVERLDALETVLDETTANGRYAERSVAAGDGPEQFVAWAADQFRSQQ
ncbi:hypothetical protein M0R88_09340 [Halorussus gelatinilyticus]|uniref:Uncharacterized protein n=1 Tax=Halorussus gelatinilyticus TaxID=2937524 RepID=A0A8U0INZ4_9EURY|nr:hypothetical protein [Halorussus gelatinilyticus]UPW02276.1 hypothetical protein M0R88_09340 [Halorussus gelatinilyticus]